MASASPIVMRPWKKWQTLSTDKRKLMLCYCFNLHTLAPIIKPCSFFADIRQMKHKSGMMLYRLEAEYDNTPRSQPPSVTVGRSRLFCQGAKAWSIASSGIMCARGQSFTCLYYQGISHIGSADSLSLHLSNRAGINPSSYPNPCQGRIPRVPFMSTFVDSEVSRGHNICTVSTRGQWTAQLPLFPWGHVGMG